MTKIVYSQDNGIAAVIIPCGAGQEINPATGKVFTIDEIAANYSKSMMGG